MVSDKVKALLELAGKTRSDLGEVLGVTSDASLSNKLRLNRFTADELIQIAGLTGARLQFTYPDGTVIPLTQDDLREEYRKTPDA